MVITIKAIIAVIATIVSISSWAGGLVRGQVGTSSQHHTAFTWCSSHSMFLRARADTQATA